ncbi:hypothetical protein chiPu_0013271 [Chiloscyllium punctatum]|uniref:Uncharacterized protein n=1 Tax=Chiloscyllium punctatum TaxID=137246 RepID=A0A401SWN6_CHIPU|nr:hypothetical protein [Chiloscyllium punctatum]
MLEFLLRLNSPVLSLHNITLDPIARDRESHSQRLPPLPNGPTPLPTLQNQPLSSWSGINRRDSDTKRNPEGLSWVNSPA